MLDEAELGLGEGVIEAVSDRPDRRDSPQLDESFPPTDGGELAAGVGVGA
ncbi:MAG: hypothetical protein WEA29_02890 [Acidimicrobiia bacterium]